jgi:hypothetical protein
MAFSAKEIRAVQQKRAAALAASTNETHTEPVSAEAHAARISYIPSWVLIGSVLIVALSVSYYYVIFLPKQERTRTALKALELSLAEQRMEAAMQRTEETEQQKEAKANLTAIMQAALLDTCLDEARKDYEKEWAKKCRLVAESTANGLQYCLSENRYMPDMKEMCEKVWGEIDAGPNCSLPHETARFADDRHEKAKDECFKRYPPS